MDKHKIIFFLIFAFIIIFQVGASSAAETIYNDYTGDSGLVVDNDNLPPVTDFSFTKMHKVDIVFAIGAGTYSLSAVQSKISSIVDPILTGKSIDANYNVINSDGAINTILPGITWGESSERYYVAISNGTFPELSKSSNLVDVIGDLGHNQVSFIGMGNSANQAIIEKLVSNNSGKGFFVSNANIDTAFTRLANYIAGNINIDLFFNVGLGPVTADVVKEKYESIVKPKLVANDISANVNINIGTYNSVVGAKIVSPPGQTSSDIPTFPLVLKPDGTLWNLSAGTRIVGENGVGYLENIVDIASGQNKYWAVDAEGYVYQWNNNPSRHGIPYPEKLPGEGTGQPYMTDVIKVAVSYDGIYVLRKDGTIWYRGNFSHTTGTNTHPTAHTWSQPDFVQAKAENGSILTNVTQIGAAGDATGCFALDSSGNLYMLPGTYICSSRTIYTSTKLIDTQVNKLSVGEQLYGATDYHDDDSHSGYGPNFSMDYVVYSKTNGYLYRLAHYDTGPSNDEYEGMDCQVPDGIQPYNFYKDTKSSKIASIFALPYQAQILRDNGTMERIAYQYEFNSTGGYGGYGISNGNIYTMCLNDNAYSYFIKNNGEVWSQFRNKAATFTGFNASVNGAYLYNDVLSSAPFKDVNDQYFVELSDTVLPELSDSTALSKITNILNNSNINTIGIGSSSNSTQLQYLNTLNNGKGAFYDISNIDAAMNSLADYIVNNSMRPPRLINDYFLISDEIDPPTTFYSDIESDPYNSMWVYEHDPFHFLTNSGATIPYDNSAGYFSLDRKILSEPVASFIDTDNYGSQVGKVGGYKVKLQVQDRPKVDNTDFLDYNRNSNVVTKYLNIHRKPVANFEVKVTDMGSDYNITLTDQNYSFDLDHTSRADKGIVKRIWGIATITPEGNVSWKYSKTSDIMKSYTVPKGNNYLLSLEVQDIDGPFGFGEWSDPVIVGIPGRPVAQFSISPDPLPVTRTAVVTDTSFATIPGNTIVQRKWNVEKIGDSAFKYKDQNICKTDYSDSGVGKYKITLEVMDSSGTWSLPCVRSLTVLDTAPPVINAVPASRTWSNTDAGVALTAHDDGGSGLKRIDYVWTLNPSDVSAYSSKSAAGSSFNIQTSQSANGKWYLCARAMDNSDNYSNNGSFSVFGTYNIDKIPPTVASSFDSGTYQDSVTTTIYAHDKGGSGIKSIMYKWTNSATKPASGWMSENIAFPEDSSESISSTIDLDGIWYLHMQVTDYAGNTTYKCSGPLMIQYLSITDVTVEGYWNHWRGQVDILGKRLMNEPHRFLSLECVRINVSTEGHPDRITIRFSPELEAMEYMDRNGHSYNYSDYFGHEISFPGDSTFAVSGDNVYWEYNLPLAPSSKDWNDNRLRPQYSLTVTVYKGGRSVTRTIDDIDITGNIYDLTYIQPRD